MEVLKLQNSAACAIIPSLLYLMSTRQSHGFIEDAGARRNSCRLAAKMCFHENLKLELLASFSRHRVSFVFGVFVDLFDKQIEGSVLVASLSRRSEFRRHFEAIGMVVYLKKWMYWGKIAPGGCVEGRLRPAQMFRVIPRVLGWCIGSAGL